jgi:hypothetical protein
VPGLPGRGDFSPSCRALRSQSPNRPAADTAASTGVGVTADREWRNTDFPVCAPSGVALRCLSKWKSGQNVHLAHRPQARVPSSRDGGGSGGCRGRCRWQRPARCPMAPETPAQHQSCARSTSTRLRLARWCAAWSRPDRNRPLPDFLGNKPGWKCRPALSSRR